ncbi:hypothetical protein pb186bvf_005281 [Paramecium bursaria]
MLILLLPIVLGCIWQDDTGYTYDLTKLDKPGGWQIKDDQSGMGMFSMVYIFNFCDFHAIKCHDKQVAAMEALAVMGQITENCDVAGQVDSKKVTHIDQNDLQQGILISYGLGDLCMDAKQQPAGVMQPRQAQFYIECGPDEKDFRVTPNGECVDQFRIKSQIGCRKKQGYLWKQLKALIGFWD